MKEMHEGGGRGEGGGVALWSVVALATLIPKPSHRDVHTASTYNDCECECCGMYSSPNRKCFRNKGRDRVEKGFHFQLFQKQCRGGL